MVSDKAVYLEELDKLINKFILRSKEFIEYSAFPFGTFDAIGYGEVNSKFTYDHEYFNFTKSSKTLISIRKFVTYLKLNIMKMY